VNDLLKDGDMLPVATIAEHVTGQRPSRPTIWRWTHKGVSGGVTLDAVPIYGQWQTTKAAFHDFLRRRSDSVLRSRQTVSLAADADPPADGLL
jgi:hypothetical protein